MGKAIIAFILSVGVGTWLSFFNHGIGVVVSISIIGAFLGFVWLIRYNRILHYSVLNFLRAFSLS